MFNLPKTYREALAIHDIMGTHGVPMANIFVLLVHNHQLADVSLVGTHQLAVVAKHRADDDLSKAFVAVAGPVDDAKTFEAEWNNVVKTYNASPKHDRAELLDTSEARERAVQIIAGLVLKGFKPSSLAALDEQQAQ